MNLDNGQWREFLGCNLVDEVLATISEDWEQHLSYLHYCIINICQPELNIPKETQFRLDNSNGKREERFRNAQKALQTFLDKAKRTSLNTSSTEKIGRVTRAAARKRVKESIAGSGGNQSLESNTSANDSKVKRNAKGKSKKDEQEVFAKPPGAIVKPDNQSQSIKSERDEIDFKTSDGEEFVSFKVSPIPNICEPMDDGEDPTIWNVKRTEIISQPKQEKESLTPVSNAIEFQAVTPIQNVKKVSPESGPQDGEWTTDEESFESIKSIGDETYARMIRKKSPNSSRKLSTLKKKRKQTEYFTPSIPRKSSRLTRATAKLEVTPKVDNLAVHSRLSRTASAVKSARKVLSEKSSGATTSGSSIASSATTITSLGRSDSVKGKTAVSRTCTTPDSKSLTASALKRRAEEDEKRKAQLAAMEEKEKKAIQQRLENLKQKSLVTKLKNEERMKKMELRKKKEEEEMKEKRKRELSKQMEKQKELDERRKEKEDARRREALRAQEAAKRKKEEFELRKQQEEEERKARLLKQEEQFRKKVEETELIKKEQEKIMILIASHNKNLHYGQQKEKPFAVPTKNEPTSFKAPLPVKTDTPPVLPLNSTFSVDKESESVPMKEEQSTKKRESSQNNYQITPPPKPKPMPVNYDISDIKSDDDTDDEDRPRKQIPSWAKGDCLISALDKQFAKSRRAREREIRQIFPNFDFSIRLSEIFKSNRVVHPKYDKRTSSAVWSSPPCNSTFNCSVLTDEL